MQSNCSGATTNRCSSTSVEDMTEGLQPLASGQLSFRVEPAMRRSQELPLASDNVGVTPTQPAKKRMRTVDMVSLIVDDLNYRNSDESVSK